MQDISLTDKRDANNVSLIANNAQILTLVMSAKLELTTALSTTLVLNALTANVIPVQLTLVLIALKAISSTQQANVCIVLLIV